MDSGLPSKNRSSSSSHSPILILLALEGIRLARGDDADDLVLLTVAVADHQRSQLPAASEKHKPVLIIGMLLVGAHQGVVVEEDCPGLLEGHAVLPTV